MTKSCRWMSRKKVCRPDLHSYFCLAITLAQAVSDLPTIQAPWLANQKNLLRGARAPLRPTSSHGTMTDRPSGQSHKGAEQSALQTQPSDDKPTETELEAKIDFGYGAELVVNSCLIWRGQNDSRGPALQPTLWVSFWSLEASLLLSCLLNLKFVWQSPVPLRFSWRSVESCCSFQ